MTLLLVADQEKTQSDGDHGQVYALAFFAVFGPDDYSAVSNYLASELLSCSLSLASSAQLFHRDLDHMFSIKNSLMSASDTKNRQYS